MSKILKATRFGNPVLRQTARHLKTNEILSEEIQNLIENMRYTLEKKKYGVGLAAPQVGVSLALSIIGIKPTLNRPDIERFDQVLVNPEIIETYGRRKQLWEGCISCGTGKDTLFAKVPRYKKVKLRWLDEHGKRHEKILDGIPAHVVQHETDHLNGILFVDRVKDSTSYTMSDEYRQRVVKAKNEKSYD